MTTLFEMLAGQNPWWSGQPFDTGRERQKYLATIRRYLKTDEIIVLSGVRRSGKTTLLYQTIRLLITANKVPSRNILFVNCDDPEIAGRKNALLEAVDTYRREIAVKGMIYLVFDEVQAVENWERDVKSLYDRKHCTGFEDHRDHPGDVEGRIGERDDTDIGGNERPRALAVPEGRGRPPGRGEPPRPAGRAVARAIHVRNG